MSLSDKEVKYFCNMQYDIAASQDFPQKVLSRLSVRTVSDNLLQVKNRSCFPVAISFKNRFLYQDIISKTDSQGCNILKPFSSSAGNIPFYFSLTSSHKQPENSADKYPYADFCLEFFDKNNDKLGEIKVTPNINIMLTERFIKQSIPVSQISYLKFSLAVKSVCKFQLNFLAFAFVDCMSTHSVYSSAFDVFCRFRVNNLKKKKNGVIIFFPSVYAQERDSDSIKRGDHSVKWPNYTRHSWSKDLEKYCTIFVADPFQYVKGNDKSSWFLAANGNTVLAEIAEAIGKIIEIPACGPIINYGSSMGGYAALVFSCFLHPALCFCECPQANLLEYKYSYIKTRCDKNLGNDYLSFANIIRKHKPLFKFLVHFYSLDEFHVDCFNNEISLLTSDERKALNYQLIVENDIENQLFTHQPMPKDKVLEIFDYYLSRDN